MIITDAINQIETEENGLISFNKIVNLNRLVTTNITGIGFTIAEPQRVELICDTVHPCLSVRRPSNWIAVNTVGNNVATTAYVDRVSELERRIEQLESMLQGREDSVS